jgi:hypothetical protein
MCTSHRATTAGGTAALDRCVDCEQAGAYDRGVLSERARHMHHRYLAGLGSLSPGVERLVRTTHYLAGISIGRTVKSGPLRFEPILIDLYPDLAHICPDFWPGGPATVNLLAPPWSPSAAAAWFLSRMAETGKLPNATLQGWVTTGNWWHGRHSEMAPPLPAWRLQEGSLSHVSQLGKRGADRRADAFVVVPDGRVMLSYDTPCLLSARGLVSMGVLLWGQPRKPWDGD